MVLVLTFSMLSYIYLTNVKISHTQLVYFLRDYGPLFLFKKTLLTLPLLGHFCTCAVRLTMFILLKSKTTNNLYFPEANIQLVSIHYY